MKALKKAPSSSNRRRGFLLNKNKLDSSIQKVLRWLQVVQ